MPTHPAHIEEIRSASRAMVRELGFMGGSFAGTELSPSAVHALIEIGKGDMTARDLGLKLRLEKSSVSRMLHKLVASGDVRMQAGKADSRIKRLRLTAAGKRRLEAIHVFGHAQVTGALRHLTQGQSRTVREGLRLYSQALAPQAEHLPVPPEAEIIPGYQPGIIAAITRIHALYYARESGFGLRFESGVAGGLADFCNRLESPRNAIWTAIQDGEIVGSIAMDGQDLGAGIAHLRWFILDDSARGTGVGKRLLDAALAFADEGDFSETHLWTFSGLDAARHLYETKGFALAEQQTGSQWGKEVLEQHFVRLRP
ncbi:helix-turn-helix domain-containing GNAT family N-acetyltransferase [Pseudoxanthomonas sp.]|uniref:bifunctional helix-turn-helix transcriptional regulator/GNAT family N-acetyltransferase n=1 Tax=Pseudoxanthomonas sp. TaxID=1871049 RepID=UPI00261D885F|nr:helix-turn-helix domain-containing GNAT family N-acetyltransferase [Pseudoxanthomonas sp.]WDS35462.1 MAG: helix-turn-helix domain-containing GNAT family N-acetyltransferase [Pseudoxanthomonas sp.]